MDFGYDLLVNPQKVKPYVKTKDIGKKQQNIELLGREEKPDLVIDMIEDDIVEHFPQIHTKIDNSILREIIHLSIQKYKKIEKCQNLEIPEYLPFPKKHTEKDYFLPKKIINKPPISPPKFININPSISSFDLTKLH